MTRSTEELKRRSEAYLASIDLDTNPSLPEIESVQDVSPRSAKDVARMCVALGYMIRIGHGYPIPEASEQLGKLGVYTVLGGTGRRILDTGTMTEQESIDLTWQSEAMQAIAWALGLAELDHTRQHDGDLAARLPFQEGERAFIDAARLRDVDEIQAQVDLIYRMHWYAVNCRFTRKPCALDESVIRERRRALDWMYGIDPDWDAIPMDT